MSCKQNITDYVLYIPVSIDELKHVFIYPAQYFNKPLR
jgi:hypothetical protein